MKLNSFLVLGMFVLMSACGSDAEPLVIQKLPESSVVPLSRSDSSENKEGAGTHNFAIRPVGICTRDLNPWGNPSICQCPWHFVYNPVTGLCHYQQSQAPHP